MGLKLLTGAVAAGQVIVLTSLMLSMAFIAAPDFVSKHNRKRRLFACDADEYDDIWLPSLARSNDG
jgi:hypothetical protein